MDGDFREKCGSITQKIGLRIFAEVRLGELSPPGARCFPEAFMLKGGDWFEFT
jgi:hypothetical protein